MLRGEVELAVALLGFGSGRGQGRLQELGKWRGKGGEHGPRLGLKRGGGAVKLAMAEVLVEDEEGGEFSGLEVGEHRSKPRPLW